MNTELQNQLIYSIFVRNHTPEGNFRAIIPDLTRIRALGTDIIWLMPIHPIGELARKGSLGSPYANRDYRAINSELGTMDDFCALVDAIHAHGMKCLIDVVYNHTSPDSVLWEKHPEWFYLRPDGTPGNHVGDWTDIIDLDYSVSDLWDYQIESLVNWAKIVDGFRCDVASFVPVEFWKKARAACERVRPSCIWLAETVHRSFGRKMRAQELYCATDTEAFEAFDIEYAYDVQEVFDAWLEGHAPLSHYLDLLDFQESVYPRGFNKLRFLENHDCPRIASRANSSLALKNLTAFMYFLKGTSLIYAGQEVASTHQPSLFDKDTIEWNTGNDLSSLMSKLYEIKKTRFTPDDVFTASADDEHDVCVLTRKGGSQLILGIFSLRGKHTELSLELKDGVYKNLLANTYIQVRDNKFAYDGQPIIISVEA